MKASLTQCTQFSGRMSNSVLQSWLEGIPWKQQSILFSSLRGPDQERLHYIKTASRWMRSVTQNNADPNKPYMNFGASTTGQPTPSNTLPSADDLCAELEYCTVHFAHHFCDGLAVIAHHHPDKDVAEQAAKWHYFIAEELFHWTPEPRETFLLRHRDKKIQGYDRRENEWSDWYISTYNTWLSTVMNRFKNDVDVPVPVQAERFYSRLQSLKKVMGWTWDQTIKKVGLSRTTLRFIKSGKQVVGSNLWHRLDAAETAAGLSG